MRAVVVPFAVPEDARNLGIGLAALLHAFARIEGESVALAQLLTREDGAEARAVEAFVSPSTWRELAGRGTTHEEVGLVVTGVLEPPSDGRGSLRLVAFDPKSGRTRAELELELDSDTAGAGVLRAIRRLCDEVGGEPGQIQDLADLGWECLESVLRAERCILHSPLRGGAHDRLAALLHLGRAVADAPLARFPAARLASIALDAVLERPDDARAAAAALRALDRALLDAPEHAELSEAAAALHLRSGGFTSAQELVIAALARPATPAPARPRLHALLAEARRGCRDLDGAALAIREGLTLSPTEASLLTERGALALDRGEVEVARSSFAEALGHAPGYPPAFLGLLGIAARAPAAPLVEELAFQAAALRALPAEVVRRVLRLYLDQPPCPGGGRSAQERAECTVQLASRLVAEGTDAWAELTLARAQVALGDFDSAHAHLAHVEASAPATALAAEACRARFAIEQPRVALELERVVRDAEDNPPCSDAELVAMSSRAQSLAADNDVWTAHLALGMAERRRARWQEARLALETAVAKSPGATLAHLELVAVHVALGSTQKALEHADRACALEGDTARTHAVRATALLAASRPVDAREAIDRALALDASDASHRALADRIRATLEPVTTFERLRQVFRFKKR